MGAAAHALAGPRRVLLRNHRRSVQPIANGQGLLVVNGRKLQSLDAATGRLLREYPEAGTPKDICLQGDTLLAIDDASLRALDLDSGRLRWKQAAAEARCVAGGDGVFALEGDGAEAYSGG